MTSLAPLLQEYFTSYLVGQRAASPATVHTYRDTWRLFLSYLAEDTGKRAHQLDMADIDPVTVVGFLDHLELDRHNSVSTRNLRLAAIRSVLAHAAANTPEMLDTIARIHAIPVKKRPRLDVSYLTDEQTQAVLDAIDTTSWTGRRDNAMFALAAQTGLRISEIIGLTAASLELVAVAPHVECTGKGRKHRITPLTHATAAVLTEYLRERALRPGTALFPNPRGMALSADAINRRLHIYVTRAKDHCVSLVGMHVSMHTLRHTAAMRLLAAGIDTSVIALWLGHEQIATTGVYLHADISIKQRALDHTRPPQTKPGVYQPADSLLSWLESL